MASTPSTLGVVEDHYVAYDDERVGWFRHKSVEHTITYLDWTIDGRPLRELVRYVDGSAPREVTVLQNDWSAIGVGRSLLKSLLGLPVGGGFDVVMPDGRIALLFCPTCFDLDCGTLTAEVEFSDTFVLRRDIAWQVGYDPLDLTDSEFDPPTLTFDRAQYEAELKRLLNLERARLSGGS
jgi:hypothetical protein